MKLEEVRFAFYQATDGHLCRAAHWTCPKCLEDIRAALVFAHGTTMENADTDKSDNRLLAILGLHLC